MILHACLFEGISPTKDDCFCSEIFQPALWFLFVAFSCDPGHYVDVNSKTLECKICPKGTYSVGGGVRFNNWDKLPTGFESRISSEHYSGYGYDSEYFHEEKSGNCSK